MADNILFLHPVDPFLELKDKNEFIAHLHSIGVIGELQTHKFLPDYYQPGPRFLDLFELTEFWRALVPDFETGQVASELPNWETYRIELEVFTNKPEIIGLTNSYGSAPSCSFCGQEDAGWVDGLQEWLESNRESLWLCANCQRATPPWDWDWKGGLGFGRYAINIWNVHKNEARPNARLLDNLKQFTDSEWTWFYYRF